MYAIVEIAGQQFKVKEGQKIFVHRLEAEEGKTVEFDKVLLVEDDGKIMIGEPFINNFIVEGTVLNDKVRGDKVIVFKKKRKKGYRVKNGHRQNFTQIEVVHIGGKDAPRKEKVKPTGAKTVEVTETEVETKPAEKKSPAKKSSTKKAEKEEKKSGSDTTAKKKATEKKKTAKKSSGKKE